MDRYGSENDYKRRKNFYASSTRRDFKSSSGPASSAPGLDLLLLSQSRPPARAEKTTASDYASRPRFRDSVSTGSALSLGARANSYMKDSRYPYGNKLYSSYQSGYYQERNSDRGTERSSTGAYGSFNGTKRDSDYQNYPSRDSQSYSSRDSQNYSSRDSTSRDMLNGGPRENLFSRDSWRGDRPKLSTSGPSKQFSSGRFNPNSIPLNARNGLNGAVPAIPNDHKNERYDSYNDSSYGNRWKSSYSQRSDKGNRSSRPPPFGGRQKSAKERIRSSGLTNSLGTPKRGGSYYPSQQYPALSSRYTDRYSGKDYEYSTERNEDYDGRVDRSMSPNSEDYRYSEDIRSGHDDSPDVSLENVDDEEEKGHHPEVDEQIDDMDDEEEREEEEEEEEEEEGEDEDEAAGYDRNKIEGMHYKGNDEDALDAEEKSITKLNDDKVGPEEPVKLHRAHLLVVSDSKSSETQDVIVSVPVDLDGPVDYPEGCNFPLGEIETQFLEISEEFHKLNSKAQEGSFMKFCLAKSVSELSEYPFYKSNLVHFSNSFPSYLEIVRGNKQSVKKKKLSLRVKYETLRKENDKKRIFLEEQLKVLHPPDDDMTRELESIDIRVKTTEPATEVNYPHADSPPQVGRRGRRHGDLVTTEAEFQEILKSLENEQNEDPVKRAERVAATIPDLILDLVKRDGIKYMDSNNIVHDKEAWTTRIKTDFMDNFTEREHELFCEGFCRFPKRFGQISRFMGGIRDAKECVVHYYMTKKAVNYKFLVSQFKKKNTKKVTRRKPKAKAIAQESSAESAFSSTVEYSDSLKSPPPKAAKQLQNTEADVEIKKKRRIEQSTDKPNDVIKTEEAESHPRKKSKSKGDEEAVKVPVQPVEVTSTSDQIVNNANGPVELIVRGEQIVSTTSPVPEIPAAIVPQGDLVVMPGNLEEKKKHISSYWSITEVNEFPNLLKIYGSRWSSIAEKLATKTATMVRNYYQRNGNKHGWADMVQSADFRLAQDSNAENGKFSNVDTTIVVKPQKTSHIDVPKTEIHVYDAVNELGRRNDGYPLPGVHTLPQFQQPTVPMGTFQHSASYYSARLPGLLNNPPEIKRLQVNELLSTPVRDTVIPEPSPSSHVTYRGQTYANIAPAPAPPITPAFAPAPMLTPRPEPPRKQAPKSSIMNLLNSEATTVVEQPVRPLPPSKANNLASLLNTQAAPTTLQPPAQSEERRSSIKSLLAD